MGEGLSPLFRRKDSFLGDLLKIICIGDLLLHLHFLKHFFLDIRDWMGYLVEMLYDSSN
jgi:hypothetical protein